MGRVLAERLFGVRVAGQKEAVDAVALGSVHGKGRVVGVQCVELADGPAMRILNDLHLLGAAAAL